MQKRERDNDMAENKIEDVADLLKISIGEVFTDGDKYKIHEKYGLVYLRGDDKESLKEGKIVYL